jgi:alpha-L-fucosidase 2
VVGHPDPPLPEQWPTGTAQGLRARGGITVDLLWQDRTLRHARLTTTASRRDLTIAAPGPGPAMRVIRTDARPVTAAQRLLPSGQRLIIIASPEAATYVIEPAQ